MSELNICPRIEWGAETATDHNAITAFPADTVLLLYTNTDPCHDKEACLKTVKALQKEQMKQNMSDIQWNFLVGGDGSVFEGRGWWRAASKDPEYEQYHELSIDIAFIGRPGDVTKKMRDAVEDLIEFGAERSFVLRTKDPGLHIIEQPDHDFKSFQG